MMTRKEKGEKLLKQKNEWINEELKEIKQKFLNNQYIENDYIETYSLNNDGTLDEKKVRKIVLLAETLGIELANRTKGWINSNLIGCWGNKRIRCKQQSDKIFEILNLIMEKLEEN